MTEISKLISLLIESDTKALTETVKHIIFL